MQGNSDLMSLPLDAVVKTWFAGKEQFIKGHQQSSWKIIAVDLKRNFILLQRRSL